MVAEVVAKFDYDPTKDDELRLRKGDVIEVEERSEDGWWKGRNNGRSGWFPGNYTEEVEKISQPPFNPLPTPAQHPASSSAHTTKPLQVVVAMFPFLAETLDELGFCEGERLDVIDYSTKDWWTARNVAGKVGLIPNNHVRTVMTGASLKTNLGGPYACKPWYFGNAGRNEVDEVLQGGAYGDYLIRDSTTQPGSYSLSVNTQAGSKHFLIRFQGGIFRIGDRSFMSIDALINHFSRCPIVDTPSEKLYLQQPVA